MSSHLVAGVPLPDAVGGHPALDFCNTRAGWGSGSPKEYLRTPAALALWAVDAGLLPHVSEAAAAGSGSAGTAAGRRALERALALRESLYRCALGHGGPADWRLLAVGAVAARAASALVPGPAGARWELAPGAAAPPDLALHAAAAAAEDLLTSPLALSVAACPGDGCGWLFADPRRRRRWCSMAVCGNRAKARRHAARARTAP